MLAACGCTHNDTEGLINLPLTAREIQAVVFFKMSAERRSPGQHAVEVRRRRARGRQRSSAAAATRTPPASPSPAQLEDVQRPHRRSARKGRRRRAARHVRRNERRPRRRQAVGPDLARRRRRACGERLERAASATPARSIRSRPACSPLVVGRATRLAQFLSSDEKEYVADVAVRGQPRRPTMPLGSELPHEGRCRPIDLSRLGWRARRVPRHVPPDAACLLGEEGRGDAGVRARAVGSSRRSSSRSKSRSRRSRSSEQGERRASLRVVCSSGFYVRSLAHDLGQSARLRSAPRGAAPDAGGHVLDWRTRCRSTALEHEGGAAATAADSARAAAAGYPCGRADGGRCAACAARQHVVPPSAHGVGAMPPTARVRLLDAAGRRSLGSPNWSPAGFCIRSSSWCKILSRLEL